MFLKLIRFLFAMAYEKSVAIELFLKEQPSLNPKTRTMTSEKRELAREELLNILKERFEKNPKRHQGLDWVKIQSKLEANPKKIEILHEMEVTGGEPDVVVLADSKAEELTFIDCSAESPAGRRSCCFDLEAWESRKQNKPATNAMEMAAEMGVEILSEDQYRQLQQVGKLDTKTSSWIQPPAAIRKLGGALFCDRRYEHVFLYHNGADSYYAARGFRGVLRV